MITYFDPDRTAIRYRDPVIIFLLIEMTSLLNNGCMSNAF